MSISIPLQKQNKNFYFIKTTTDFIILYCELIFNVRKTSSRKLLDPLTGPNHVRFELFAVVVSVCKQNRK